MNWLTKKELLIAVLVIILFITAAYLSDLYSDTLEILIGQRGIAGIIAYVGLVILAVVIAPVSTFPLLPVAVTLWGSLTASILNIIGWTAGAVIAFWLARRLGRPIVRRLASLERIEQLSNRMPKKNIFWSVVFLRMAIPVDILSYALGLLVPMPIGHYTLATLIGVTPFAFIFSYAAGLPIGYQITAGLIAIAVIMAGLIKLRNSK